MATKKTKQPAITTTTATSKAPQADKDGISNFMKKCESVDIQRQIVRGGGFAPVYGTILKKDTKQKINFGPTLFAYNEFSAKEYVNAEEGFEFNLEVEDVSYHCCFGYRFAGQPDLVKVFCDKELGENDDYDAPMISLENGGDNGFAIRWRDLNVYAHRGLELTGDLRRVGPQSECLMWNGVYSTYA